VEKNCEKHVALKGSTLERAPVLAPTRHIDVWDLIEGIIMEPIVPHERMTIRELVDAYNSYGPVKPLKTWKGKKYDLFLMALTAMKQQWHEGSSRLVGTADVPVSEPPNEGREV
jgi:hypothetical protein